MFDLKYHVTSLVAVFLALGMGILIGNLMLDDSLLVDQQSRLIDQLEGEFRSLREQSRSSQLLVQEQKQTIQQYQAYEQDTFKLLVENRLNGLKVALVRTGDYPVRAELLQNLQLAGAQVTSVTELQREYYSPQALDLVLNTQIAVLAATGVSPLATLLIEGLFRQDARQLLEPLATSNLAKLQGSYGVPVDYVVLLGGHLLDPSRWVAEVELPLIRRLRGEGIRMVGVEDSQVGVSSIKHFQSQHLTTVDNIDTRVGQVALILSLAGSSGQFGAKKTAKQLLPVFDQDYDGKK